MNPYLARLLDHLLPIVFSVVVIPLSAVLLKFIIQKLNLHLDELTEQKLSDVCTEALTYAEEWARAQIKTTGDKPAGAQKLEAALAYAINEAERRGLDKWAVDFLTKKLIAALGMARDPTAPAPVPDATKG